MQDVREYSENELSLRVFNDEGLYLMRHTSFLIEYIKTIFVFSDRQLEVLVLDLIDEKELSHV